LGDIVEVQALSRIFSAHARVSPSCAWASVKSMIGHAMPAAGIAGVIKAALRFTQPRAAATINCDEPNPALHLEKTPFYVNTETRPWIQRGRTRPPRAASFFRLCGSMRTCVLEEHSAEKTDVAVTSFNWESEVCIIEAESRKDLIEPKWSP